MSSDVDRLVEEAVKRNVGGVIAQTLPYSLGYESCAAVRNAIEGFLSPKESFRVIVNNRGGGFDVTIVRIS